MSDLHCSACTCAERAPLEGIPTACVSTIEQVDAQIDYILLTLAHVRRHRNALVPISRLPPEILIEILRRHCDQFATLVSSVCYSWRAMSKADPLLWNCIDLRDPKAAGSSMQLSPATTCAATIEHVDAHIHSILITLAHIRRYRNALLPISRLPPEILLESFRRHRNPFATPVSRVCYSWRALTHADPLIWKCINLRNMKSARSAVRFSPGCLFHVYLPFSHSSLDFEGIRGLPRLLDSVPGHIDSLDFEAASPDIMECFFSVMSGYLGNVTEVVLDVGNGSSRVYDLGDIVSKHLSPPLLRVLILRKLCLHWDSPFLRNSIHLQRLRLEFPIGRADCPSFELPDVLETLRLLPDLRELSLILALPSRGSRVPPTDEPLEPSVELPFLTLLNVDDNVEDALYFVRHLRISPHCGTSFIVYEYSEDLEHSMILLRQTFDCPQAHYAVYLLHSDKSNALHVRTYMVDPETPRRRLRVCNARSYIPYLETISSEGTGNIILSSNAHIDPQWWKILFRCTSLRIKMPTVSSQAADMMDSLCSALDEDPSVIDSYVISRMDWDNLLRKVPYLVISLRAHIERNGIPSVSLRLDECRSLPENALSRFRDFHEGFEKDGTAYTIMIRARDDAALLTMVRDD